MKAKKMKKVEKTVFFLSFFLSLSLLFAVLCQGCHVQPDSLPSALPRSTPSEEKSYSLQEAIQEIKRRGTLIHTVEAVCQVSSESPQKSGTFSAILLLQDPHDFRFVGYRSFLGSTLLFDLKIQNQDLCFYLPSENKVLRSSKNATLPFFAGQEMLTSFFGIAQAQFLLLEETPESYFFALLTPEGKWQQTLKAQKKTLWITEQNFYSTEGIPSLSIKYSRYQPSPAPENSLDWPYEVKILQVDSQMRLIFQELRLNLPLEKEAFQQEIPEDVEEVDSLKKVER
jgi:hypothetical protein